jgi:site-specific recombinase XerD
MVSSESCIKQFLTDNSFRLDKKTLDKYKSTMKQLLAFCEKPLYEITSRDIRNWLTHLNEKGNKPVTIRKKLLILRKFYQYCVDEKLMVRNPMKSVAIPKVRDKLPFYLTNDQLTQLRLLCEGLLLQRAVLELLYATGVRISELMMMKKQDINWSERMICIPNGKGNKERIVLFTKECASHLQAYLKERNDQLPFVFVNPSGTDALSYYFIEAWFKNYQKKIGIHLTPHTLRHTFAAHLAIKKMPLVCIQELLGHDNPVTTQIYARLCNNAQKQMYDEWM